MPQVKCKICNKEFYVKPSHLKMGYGKYCSRECHYEAQKKGKFVVCDVCGVTTWKAPKALKNSKSGKFFCSKKCQTVWRNKHFSGKKHANWKGGEHTYRRIMKVNKITPVCKKCKLKDERVLVVHHVDCNRKNNDIENLVWLCYNCHRLVHNHNQKI